MGRNTTQLEKILEEIIFLNDENVIVEIKNALQEKDSKAYHIWRTNEYDVNHVFYGQNPLLHFAIKKNRVDIMKALIKNGANVNALGVFGQTPIHLASMLGLTEAIKELIENGADVNATNEIGDTPLHTAISEAPIDLRLNVVKVLLQNGANPNARCKNTGETPLHTLFIASNGMGKY